MLVICILALQKKNPEIQCFFQFHSRMKAQHAMYTAIKLYIDTP